MRPTIDSPRPGRRSAWAVRPVTARVRTTLPGHATRAAGGLSGSMKIRSKGSRCISTSAATSRGGTIREPAIRSAMSRRRLLRKEVETCGLCHARRGRIFRGLGAWSVAVRHPRCVASWPRALLPGRADADEVYNYGSFKQSRMFAAGVTCSDCHDPHSAKLRASGDGVCLQCHSSDKYAAATHNHHDGVKTPIACASCHMPARTYMVVDRRHDHSFRVPRPDLSAKLGTPNACDNCHNDKSAEWAAAAIESWYGPERRGFPKIRRGVPWRVERSADDAATLLAAVASDRNYPRVRAGERIDRSCAYVYRLRMSIWRGQGLLDPDPMVRIGALDMLENVPASPNLAACRRRFSPIPAAASVSGRRRCLPRYRPRTSQPPTAKSSSAPRPNLSRAQRFNADRPEVAFGAGKFFCKTRPFGRCRGRI